LAEGQSVDRRRGKAVNTDEIERAAQKRDSNSDEQNCRTEQSVKTDNDLTFRDQASLSARSRSDGAAPSFNF